MIDIQILEAVSKVWNCSYFDFAFLNAWQAGLIAKQSCLFLLNQAAIRASE